MLTLMEVTNIEAGQAGSRRKGLEVGPRAASKVGSQKWHQTKKLVEVCKKAVVTQCMFSGVVG